MDDTTSENRLLLYIIDPDTPGGQSLREFSKSECNDENFTFIDSVNILESVKFNRLDPDSPDLNVKAALETIAYQLRPPDYSSKADNIPVREVNISAKARADLNNLEPNIIGKLTEVAKLFDQRLYQAEAVRAEILGFANSLNEAKNELTQLVQNDVVKRWYKLNVIINGKEVKDKETKKAISNKEYFMDIADKWVEHVNKPIFEPLIQPDRPGPGRSRSGAVGSDDRPLDVTSLPERSRSGAIDEGRVPLPEPIPSEGILIPSEGIPRSEGIPIPSESNPIAQEGLPETTSPSEPTPIPENPFGERNEGGGE